MNKRYEVVRDCWGYLGRYWSAGEKLEWQPGMPEPNQHFKLIGGTPTVTPKTGQGSNPPEDPKMPNERMTVAELEVFAAEHQISLEGCENKAQKLAAIKAGLEAKKPDKEPEA